MPLVSFLDVSFFLSLVGWLVGLRLIRFINNSRKSIKNKGLLLKQILHFHDIEYINGFGGLGVGCWPLVPKFAGSNPAEAVGFLGRQSPQYALLRRGSKTVGPMS